MEILLILVVGTLNVACFFIGAKVGQAVSKGEKIELPEINPLELYRKHEANKEADAEKKKLDTIMENIEAYDGTGNGQKDIPRW